MTKWLVGIPIPNSYQNSCLSVIDHDYLLGDKVFLTQIIFLTGSCRRFLVFSYFTTQEANNALPEVIRKFRNSVKLKNEIARIQGEIESDPSYFESFEKYIPKKQELNSAIREFYQSIEDLEKTGVTVKSLDEGLVDFPSKRFDEEVWLCWKEGESEIKFWHGKDEGFMGRKPISVSNESLV